MLLVSKWFAVLALLATGLRGGRRSKTQEKRTPGAVLKSNETRAVELASSSLLQQPPEAAKQNPLVIPFDCQAFTGVVDCSEMPPEFMGMGRYGQAWKVKEHETGREVVLKVLYVKTRDNGDPDAPKARYLRASDLQDPLVKKMANEAKTECKHARELAEDFPGVQLVGRQRFVQCYGHNMDAGSSDKTPLHVKLESCGQSLKQLVDASPDDPSYDLSAIMQIMKQILEGLQFLQALPAPYMHHDLKPPNVAVSKIVDPASGATTFRVKILDLGSMVRYGADVHENREIALKEITTCTTGFAPSEWKSVLQLAATRTRRVAKPQEYNFSPAFPDRFDVFGAGAILLQMLTTLRLVELIPWLEGVDRNKVFQSQARLNFGYVWSVVARERFLDDLAGAMEGGADSGAGTGAARFLSQLKQSEAATRRPCSAWRSRRRIGPPWTTC